MIDKLTSNADVKVSMFGGNCPVQGEGTYKGKPWYFRSRGNRWRLYISQDPRLHALDDKDAWVYEEAYGETAFEAGWMPEDEAVDYILNAFEKYDEDILKNVDKYSSF